MSALPDKVEATIRRHDMLRDGGKVVLAVSGGPDSLCLLHVMSDLAHTRFSGISLHVGHLHHGMRGAAGDDDAAFVAAQAASLGVECTVERADVPGLARERGVGEEVAGRDARYAFLEQLANSLGARHVATGHNADDQAETVLMRCMRGAGPRGLAGIPYVRRLGVTSEIRIIRPLLDCGRDEILAFLLERGLSGRLDSTNLSPRYLRNRVRREILPRMDGEIGTGAKASLRRLAGLARGLQTAARPLLKTLQARMNVRREADAVEIDAGGMPELGAGIQAELIGEWLREAGLSARMLTSRHYEAVRALLEAGAGSADLAGGVRARLSSGRLRLERRSGTASCESPDVAISIPGATGLPEGRILAEVMDAAGSGVNPSGDPLEAVMDMECIRGELRARFPRPGDRMRPMGAPGRRKLQDILTDLRVPKWRRGSVVVVTMNDDPVWIAGYRIAESVRLTPGTRRVLRLRYEPGKAGQGAGAGSAEGGVAAAGDSTAPVSAPDGG